jgi:hypothetical protein
MEELCSDLSQLEYLDDNNLQMVKLWSQVLNKSNYSFPPIQLRHQNVVIIGQFNYNMSPRKVLL